MIKQKQTKTRYMYTVKLKHQNRQSTFKGGQSTARLNIIR